MYKVLAVENNPTILRLISHHLECAGCEVMTAVDGLAALIMLDKVTPDILFTDIIMPKVSGDQLCKIIRNTPKLKDIFIAVHSSTTIEDNQLISDMDADVYIAKGQRSYLKQHVHHVLEQFKKGVRRSPEIIGGELLHPREITRELLLARRHYHAIFSNVAEAVIELDDTGQIIQANRASQKLFGKNILSFLSSHFKDHLSGPGVNEVLTWIDQVHDSRSARFKSSYDNPLLANNHRILLNMVSIKEQDTFFIIAILQDISLQKTTEEKLAKTVGEFNAVIDTINYGILLMDAEFKTRIVNQAYRNMWGIPESFTDGNPTIRELISYNRDTGVYDVPADSFDLYIDKRVEAIQRGAIAPMELKRGDGNVYQFQCVVLPDNGRLLTYYDITSMKRAEEKLGEALEKVSLLANHDPLTGLPNLRLAGENLLSAISWSRRKGWKTAVMFIDLDGFKTINDTQGHEAGDNVLKEVAQRLLGSLRTSDTVARIGGDEFLVIQTEVTHRFAVANVAEKIVRRISEPFILDGKEFVIGASIGISIYPDHGEDNRILLKKADDAMYYTKRIGKNNFSFAPD